MENQITNCPMCHNHCPIDNPDCERGHKFAELLANDPVKAAEVCRSMADNQGNEHHGHADGSGGKRGSGSRAGDPDSLYGLLRRCGHALHHGSAGPEEVTAALTQQEQETLKELLKKVLGGLA